MLIRRCSVYAQSLVVVAVLNCLLLPVHCFDQTAAMGRQEDADNEYQLAAILWTQTSAEYRALAYQAFSLARLRLDQELRRRVRSAKPGAVIVDVMPQPKAHFGPGASNTGSVSNRTPSISRSAVAVPTWVIVIDIAERVLTHNDLVRRDRAHSHLRFGSWTSHVPSVQAVALSYFVPCLMQ